MVEIAQERIHQGGDENGEGTVFFCAEGGKFKLIKRFFGRVNPEILQFASCFLGHWLLRKNVDISADFNPLTFC